MELNPNHIIYLEDSYRPLLNKFIRKNRQRIDKYISKNKNVNLQFVYFPEFKDKIAYKNVLYAHPGLKPDEANQFAEQMKSLESSEFSNHILNQAGYKGSIYPGLFRYIRFLNGKHHYKYEAIPVNKRLVWRKFFRNFILEQERPSIEVPGKSEEEQAQEFLTRPVFKIDIPEKKQNIEDKFEKIGDQLTIEALQLIKEIDNPVQIAMIRNYLDKKLEEYKKESKLSRLIVHKKEIILPDYQNTIIKLTPLQMTVYVLFLNHDEGIDLTELPEYEEELLDIYLKLTNRGLLDDIKKSIKALTDPLDNSIHEKFSKIKSAFVSRFNDGLAQYYYISGHKYNPKKIAIDRNLVEIDI